MFGLEYYRKFLGDNDYSFLERVYSEGLDKYEDRLKAIGFHGKEKVLDAGCGFGQWSCALAKLNTEVVGYDYSSDRVMIASQITDQLNLDNVSFFKSSLENSNQIESSVDAIFCYGTIFITDIKASLNEFFRILKSGGVLYLNANAIGWALNCWFNEPNKTKDQDPRWNVHKMFKNTILYQNGQDKEEGQIIVEKEQMIDWLKNAGFSIDSVGAEGTLSVDHTIKPIPFFKSEYFGFDGVFEILARKPY